jgi:tRNA G18 (ribose-2'-O)-methylase SpoU
MIKLKASELRTTVPSKKHLKEIQGKRRDIYIILDDVLDTYNVGGIFRLSDAIGAKKVILCGETETPPNPRIKKASINTTEWVNWEYKEDAFSALKSLKKEVPGIKIVSVEQDEKSIPLEKADLKTPIVVVVGNETTGIKKEILDISDYIIEIPMWGVNKSLNVIISLGIFLYSGRIS